MTQKFVVGSLFAILATGIPTGFILIQTVRSQFFDEFARRTVIAQRMVTAHDLKAADFLMDNERLSGAEFDQMMRSKVLESDKDILLIKIWRWDGAILYSNQQSLIGGKKEVEGPLEQVLGDKVVFKEAGEHEDVEIAGAAPGTKLLEVYSPIKFDGRVVGAFETYFALDKVASTTRRIAATVALLLTGGLAFLWIGLSYLVKGASATIDGQNRRLQLVTEDQSKMIEKLEESYLGTMRALVATVEARDPYTSGHSLRVTYIAYLIGKELGLKETEIGRLHRASVLHDIGKIGVTDMVLRKPGALLADEWLEIRKHPEIGAEIVMSTPALADVAGIIRHHHEKYNGTGYPDGISGARIPIEARILALADAFDAMTSDRPYRKAFSCDTAVAKIEEGLGRHFDPGVTEAFVEIHRREPKTLEQTAGALIAEAYQLAR